MTARGSALRLTAYVGDSDVAHHRPVHSEIVHRAHAAGLAGASVFRGIEGFGASNRVHSSRILSLSEDLPIAVVLIDTRERIEAFLPVVTELVAGGLVVVEEVEVVRSPDPVTDGDTHGRAR
jgi:PII-like signaling protein